MSFFITYQAGPGAPAYPFAVPGEIESTNKRAFRTGGQYRLHPTSSIFARPPIALEDDPANWGPVTIRSVPAIVKTTFNRTLSTYSDLSIKARRTQTGDSQYEFSNYIDRESDHNTIEMQSHNMIMTWSSGSLEHSYSPDGVALEADGTIVVDEAKASRSYFLEPHYRALMDRVAVDLAAVGMKLREYDGSDPSLARRRYNAAKAFCERHTAFTPRQVDSVSNLLAKQPEGVPLGRIEEALKVHSSAARMVIHALLCHRKLAFDLNHQINRDTLVTAPRKPPADLPDIRAIHAHVPRPIGLSPRMEAPTKLIH
jgi:hypothetical protein